MHGFTLRPFRHVSVSCVLGLFALHVTSHRRMNLCSNKPDSTGREKIWIVAKLTLLAQLPVSGVSQSNITHSRPIRRHNYKHWPIRSKSSWPNNKKLVVNNTTSLTLVIIISDLNSLNKLPEVKFVRKSHFCRCQWSQWSVSGKVWGCICFGPVRL